MTFVTHVLPLLLNTHKRYFFVKYFCGKVFTHNFVRSEQQQSSMKQSPQTLAIIGFPVITEFFADMFRWRWPERLNLQTQLQ